MDRIWLKSYPDYVPAELPPAPFHSVRELFEHAFERWPERPAYTNMGTTLTYRDLDEQVDALCVLSATDLWPDPRRARCDHVAECPAVPDCNVRRLSCGPRRRQR